MLPLGIFWQQMDFPLVCQSYPENENVCKEVPNTPEVCAYSYISGPVIPRTVCVCSQSFENHNFRTGILTRDWELWMRF